MDETLGQYIVAGIVTIILAYMQQRTKASVDAGTKSATTAATAAAEEAKAVKTDLAGNTKDTKTLLQVASATKVLVNSNMRTLLKLHAVTARRLATLTGSEVDIKVAEAAEKNLADHDMRQYVVDVTHLPPAEPKP